MAGNEKRKDAGRDGGSSLSKGRLNPGQLPMPLHALGC